MKKPNMAGIKRPSVDARLTVSKEPVDKQNNDFNFELFCETLTKNMCIDFQIPFRMVAGRNCYFNIFEKMKEEVEC